MICYLESLSCCRCLKRWYFTNNHRSKNLNYYIGGNGSCNKFRPPVEDNTA